MICILQVWLCGSICVCIHTVECVQTYSTLPVWSRSRIYYRVAQAEIKKQDQQSWSPFDWFIFRFILQPRPHCALHPADQLLFCDLKTVAMGTTRSALITSFVRFRERNQLEKWASRLDPSSRWGAESVSWSISSCRGSGEFDSFPVSSLQEAANSHYNKRKLFIFRRCGSWQYKSLKECVGYMSPKIAILSVIKVAPTPIDESLDTWLKIELNQRKQN